MKYLITGISLMLSALSISSCQKENTKVIHIFKDGETLEQMINDFIGTETFGIENQALLITEWVNESLNQPQPSYHYDKEATFNGIYGNYAYNYTGTALRSNDSLQVALNAHGQYETFYLYSNDSVKVEWLLSAIDANTELYTSKGSSARQGEQYSKVYNDSFNSLLTFHFDGLSINRTTGAIQDGTILFAFTGTSSYGETYVNSGTLTYSNYQKVVTYDN